MHYNTVGWDFWHITLMASIQNNWKWYWPFSSWSHSGVSNQYTTVYCTLVCVWQHQVISTWLSEGWVWLCYVFLCITASDRLGGWVMARKVPSYCCWIDHMYNYSLLQVTFIMLNLDWTPIPAFVLAIGSLAFGTCGVGGFYTNMLPFRLSTKW